MKNEPKPKQEKTIEEHKVDVGKLPIMYALRNTAWLHIYDQDQEDDKDHKISFTNLQKSISKLENVTVSNPFISGGEAGGAKLTGCQISGGSLQGAAIKAGTIQDADVLSGRLSSSVTVEGAITLAGGVVTKQYVDDAISTFAANKFVCQVRLSANQTIKNGIVTKILYNTKDVDTHNYFDLAGFRFFPKTPGMYKITAEFKVSNAGQTPAYARLIFSKNGVVLKTSADGFFSSFPQSIASTLIVRFNGTTEYLEVSGYRDISSASTIEDPIIYGGNETVLIAEYMCP